MATVSIKNLTFSYDRGYENVFEDATFQFDTDWRLGLVGRNGRGKTTLLRLLLGRHDYRGSISAPCGFSYFPFEVSDADRNTLDIVDDCNPDYEFWELCRELGLLGFPEEALFRPFGTLSNGEQTKALIAALFLRRNDFLLLDEPTNHLD
ncbi:MAG: ATP-binding cassette domain-containing protein, partial [Clostridiales Family XIII bacterium]|nr:ATP-binding cassette domain-containing protein [Clostridiales Family XIII bacterium]